MRVLVWHWGRHGAGPRFAVELVAGFSGLPGVQASLSLAAGAEILTISEPPRCDLPVPTYGGWLGLAGRWMGAPAMLRRLDQALAELRPDLAVCAMPAALDPIFLAALRRREIPSVVIAHDAAPHAGDGGWVRGAWDRAVLRRADGLGVLSEHVGKEMAGRYPDMPIFSLWHPPFAMGATVPPRAHGGRPRVLSFGRLRAYKGLDLLADTLRLLPAGWDLRVVGKGPESPALAALRAVPGVHLENRWVAEAALPSLIGWADVVLLTHRAASQSGVAAAAIGAGRFVVATDVGGLAEQLRAVPGVALCAPDPAALSAALRGVVDAKAPARPDARADWRAMAAALLAAARQAGLVPGLAQRQPRAMAAASRSGIQSGPT